MHLTFRETLDTFVVLNEFVTGPMNGRTPWNTPTAKPHFTSIEPDLQRHARRAPSKPYREASGQTNGLWFLVHFGLLLPEIKALETRGQDFPELKNMLFSLQEAKEWLPPITELAAHIRQRKQHAQNLAPLLDTLPDTEDELDETLQNHLQNERAQGNHKAANHIIGRLVQAKLSLQATTPEEFGALGLPRHTQPYLQGSTDTLFERFKTYVMNGLPGCPVYDTINSGATHISAIDILTLYDWFASHKTVEMVTTAFDGAAEKVAYQMAGFLDHLRAETRGRIDFTAFEARAPVLQAFDEDQNVADFGRIAALVGKMGNPGGEETLLRLATKLCPADKRERLWGSPDRYIHAETPGILAIAENLSL